MACLLIQEPSKKNNLFFAIQGKNTDGHKFAKEALKKGAIKLVVSQKINYFFL